MWTRPAVYYTKWGRDQQPIYKMGLKTAMVMMKKNQVGDYNTLTSVRISTLFAEATRMSQPQYSSFSPKLLREEYTHFNYSNQILIPTNAHSFSACLALLSVKTGIFKFKMYQLVIHAAGAPHQSTKEYMSRAVWCKNICS